MFKQPKLENLNVLNNFLINAIANDPDVAEPFFRLLISILLDIDIDRIVVHAQAFLPGNTPERRGIQMDVVVTEYLKTDGKGATCRIYNVEAQLYPDNLPKRNRFYQAKKDSNGLKSGERNWNKLPDLYMITITNYDPFDRDSMVYTFENTCHEFPNLKYEDGLKFVYFNTSGNLNITKAKKELLKYLNSSKIENVTNSEIAQLHNYVSSVKQSAEVQNRYMTVGEWLDACAAEAIAEGRAEGHAEGHAEGLAEGTQLGRIQVLTDILADLGPVPAELHIKIQNLDDESLKQWTKLASRSENMEEFLRLLER